MQKNLRQAFVVDDEPALLSAIVEIVESLGYQAVSASRADEAKRKVEAGLRPEIAILDINLPDISGVALAEEWQNAGVEIPLLFASADASESERQAAEAISGQPVLNKPFSAQALRAAIESVAAAVRK